MEGEWIHSTARKVRLRQRNLRELIDLIEHKYKAEVRFIDRKLRRQDLSVVKRAMLLVRKSDLDGRCIPDVTIMIETMIAQGRRAPDSSAGGEKVRWNEA